MHIYTDGSCHPNPGPGGWACVFSGGRRLSGAEPATTNNRMEMTAIFEALKACKDREAPLIFSDSQYAINGCTIWRKGWVKKNYRRKEGPLLNADLWRALHAECDRVKPQFKWVRGHSGNAGNEAADRLAGAARARMVDGQAQTEPPLQTAAPAESPMSLQDACKILAAYNDWRRWDGDIGTGPAMPNPQQIGIAIDVLLAATLEKMP